MQCIQTNYKYIFDLVSFTRILIYDIYHLLMSQLSKLRCLDSKYLYIKLCHNKAIAMFCPLDCTKFVTIVFYLLNY